MADNKENQSKNYRVTYKFNSIENALNFSKSLLVDGNKYKITLTTKYEDFPRENNIDYFCVEVEDISN